MKKMIFVTLAVFSPFCPSVFEIQDKIKSGGISMPSDLQFYWNIFIGILLGLAVYALVGLFDKLKGQKNDFREIVNTFNDFELSKSHEDIKKLQDRIINFRKKYFPEKTDKKHLTMKRKEPYSNDN